MRTCRSEIGLAALGAGMLATAIVIAGLADERTAWAQDGTGSGPTCRPGLRPGSGVSGKGENGSLVQAPVQVRFCNIRGRFVYTMGGASLTKEFAPTEDHFWPSLLADMSVWVDWFIPERLCSFVPTASDLPGAKITVRLISYDTTTDDSATITLSPDTEKPTLKTTSTPPKGTKVKPGDRIKVRMEASEEYSETRRGWQTGVKKIQLIDESRNRVVPPYYEVGGPRPCKEKSWKQWLEVTYIVPPNPPPVIRLRAIAEDFAGNKDDDVGEFPTENEDVPPKNADAFPKGRSDGRGEPCIDRKIVRGMDFSFICP